MKYVKKPVVVDAMQFITNNEANSDHINNVVSWINTNGGKASHNNTDVLVLTSRGELVVAVGGWIVKNDSGEFEVCKPNIFKKTYELFETNVFNYAEPVVSEPFNPRYLNTTEGTIDMCAIGCDKCTNTACVDPALRNFRQVH